MAVVILVGLIALIAIPSATKAMRERRSSRAAHEIALLYNQAQARAIARGSAVLVRYSYASNGFEVREGITGATGMGNCQLAPASSCTVPAGRWNAGSNFNQLLTTFKPLGTSAYEMVDIEFNELSYVGGTVSKGTPAATDMCMTPGGRTFYRASNNSGTAFQAMTGNHSVKVWMHDSADVVIGIERFVFILPNGTARVGI